MKETAVTESFQTLSWDKSYETVNSDTETRKDEPS